MSAAETDRTALEQHAAYLNAPRSALAWRREAASYAFAELPADEIHRCFLDAAGRRWITPSCRHCGRVHSFQAERLASGVSWRRLQHHILSAGRDDQRTFWLVPTPNRRAEAFFDGGRIPRAARKCRALQ